MAGSEVLEPGHRLLPHTADLIIEAWGPTRESCFGEAVACLVESFADIVDAPTSVTVPFDLGPEPDEELLVLLLEEVLYLVDVLGRLPAETRISGTEEGGIAGFFEVVPTEAAVEVGPVPKAIARHGLRVGATEQGWACHATIDV